VNILNQRELVITCLADDYEDDIRIKKILELGGEKLSIRRIRMILKELLSEGLIYINWSISNKSDGYWYGMTDKGKEFWDNIPEDERMTDFMD
jgi:predicted transcriptional regulator